MSNYQKSLFVNCMVMSAGVIATTFLGFWLYSADHMFWFAITACAFCACFIMAILFLVLITMDIIKSSK